MCSRMTPIDIEYFQFCFKLGIVRGPFLEVGSAKVQLAHNMPNLCEVAHSLGIHDTLGVDLQQAPGVDVVCDFSAPPDEFRPAWSCGAFESVAIFNVLEHTFDPIGVMRNALQCVRPGGSLIVVTPAVWPIHSHPGDFTRILPNWYEEFATRYRLDLIDRGFCWLSSFGIQGIGDLRNDSGEYQYPTFLNSGRAHAKLRYWTSRVVHRAFDTYGRNHTMQHVAVGAAFRRSD